jgi:hypothetical protein
MAPRCPPDIRAQAIAELINAEGGPEQIKKAAAAVVANADNPQAFNQTVRQVGEAKLSGAIHQAWINGLLSSPKTHAVNILSNSLTAVWAVPERYLAAGISQTVGDGAITYGEASAKAFGMTKGIRDGFRLAVETSKIGLMDFTSDAANLAGIERGKTFGLDERIAAAKNRLEKESLNADLYNLFGKIEGNHTNQITGSAFGVDDAGKFGQGIAMVGKALNLPSAALQAEDAFFKSIGYRMELNALAYREAVREGLEGKELAERITSIIADPPETLKLEAVDAAAYQTFTKPLGDIGKGAQRFVRRVPGGRYVVPFIRTPTNIMKYTLERTPLAFFHKGILADIKAGGPRGAEAMARITMGSMIMIVVADMTAEGTITGAGPNDPKLRKIKMDSGWKPYSIKVGDKWVQYKRLDPIGMIVGIGADISELTADAADEESEQLAVAGVMALAQNLASKTYAQGIVEFIAAIDPNNPTSNPARYMERQIGSFVPYSSILRQTSQTIDPVLRETRTSVADEDLPDALKGLPDPVAEHIQGMINKVKSNIPGQSANLPPRRDLWGDPITRESGIGWAFDLVSPVAIATNEDDPVNKAILDNRVKLSNPPRRIDGVSLTGEEYSQFVEMAGKPAKQALDELVTSPGWDSLSDGPDGMKAEVIRNVINQFRAAARAQMVATTPSLRQRILERKTEQAGALAGTE